MDEEGNTAVMSSVELTLLSYFGIVGDSHQVRVHFRLLDGNND